MTMCVRNIVVSSIILLDFLHFTCDPMDAAVNYGDVAKESVILIYDVRMLPRLLESEESRISCLLVTCNTMAVWLLEIM